MTAYIYKVIAVLDAFLLSPGIMPPFTPPATPAPPAGPIRDLYDANEELKRAVVPLRAAMQAFFIKAGTVQNGIGKTLLAAITALEEEIDASGSSNPTAARLLNVDGYLRTALHDLRINIEGPPDENGEPKGGGDGSDAKPSCWPSCSG